MGLINLLFLLSLFIPVRLQEAFWGGGVMPVKVPDDVLKKTIKCPHKFSCLTSDQCGKHKICEVERIMGTNVIFLKDTQQAQCPYRLAFDYSQICTCPTHYAIKCIKQ